MHLKDSRQTLSRRIFRPGDLHRRAGKSNFHGSDYALHFAPAREAFILVLAASGGREKDTLVEFIIYHVGERLETKRKRRRRGKIH
jgi:hypothetical protein